MKLRPFRHKSFGDGPPIVLVPGLDGLTEFFADLVPELSRRFRVVVYELPLKAEADQGGRPYSFEFIADDLKQVLDELRIRQAHVVGESFGGVVSQVFTLAYPERVSSLTLISSAPHFELSMKNRLLLPLFRLTPMWLFARVHLGDVCEPEDPQWMKRLFVRGASYADHASVYARAQIASAVDLRERVADIHCPVLLVVGSRDRFTGTASRALLKQLQQARLVEIAGGGHLCHLSHPADVLAALIPFLTGRSSRPEDSPGTYRPPSGTLGDRLPCRDDLRGTPSAVAFSR